MLRFLVVLALTAGCILAQIGPQFAATMDFEMEHKGDYPTGWGGGPPETIALDSKVVHGGKWAVKLHRGPESANQFSTITRVIPADYAGKTIEFRGYLKTEDVSRFAGLWLRQDGDTGPVAFDNMESRQLKGTTDWTEHVISLTLSPKAKQIYFGVLISGTGTTWVDDLQLLVDGKPIWEAPKIERPKTILDTDHEFEAGSKIELTELSATQVDNLVLLGKVWGFLKYHHPRVTAGEIQWDYELFRILPTVLKAESRTVAQSALDKWVKGLGTIKDCTVCATLKEAEIHLRPKSDWLSDTKRLGVDLSATLKLVHRNRPAERKQFYLSQMPNVGNANFERELPYKDVKLPDAGYQLLAAYRFWNIVEYWFPYRDVTGEDWDQVLRQSIPKVALAKDRDAYQLEMMVLIARAHDTHANLWSSLQVRPPVGKCRLPVAIRFIGNAAVVSGYTNEDAGPATGIKVGDVVDSLDGVPVAKLVSQWAPYYAASNEPTRLRDIGRFMTRGDCGETDVRVVRGKESVEVKAKRIPEASVKLPATHDLPGETFSKLSDDVAYLKLSSIQGSRAKQHIESAAGTKGLVIDIRNYPSEFVVFTLGGLLVDQPVEFVRFTNLDQTNPGAFHFGQPLKLEPQPPHYKGKVIILVDELSVSQSEYTTMAFRAAPGAVVIGSTTAGADGNVSPILLPGGLRTMISGIGVFYPDKRPTQRVGIIPDIEAKPTIEGIREGRDEVLERALREILGPEVPAAELQKLAKPAA